MDMEVKRDRLMSRINSLAKFNETPGCGVTRYSYSTLDKQARAYIREICEEISLNVYVDQIGNIRARYQGMDDSLAPVWIGSHIDSVRNGGKYDGIVGVISALEVLNVFFEHNIRPVRPVELVIFAEEEGSNFGTTMLGSKALVGKCSKDYLKKLKNEGGETAYEVIKGFGLQPDEVEKCRLNPSDVYAMVEMHIEQGAVLDKEGLTIGVVQAIAGMCTYRIIIHGSSDHAGSTPMDMRRDPMTAAAKLICDIEEYVKRNVYHTTVATIGEIECQPNKPNVIPQKVQFSVDIRDVHQDGMERVISFIREKGKKIEAETGVVIEIAEVGKSKCIQLSQRIAGIIEEVTVEKGYPYKCMNSGAVHDAAMITEVTDVGMIFVPSVDGRSHTVEEYTEAGDIKKGADILLETVKRLAL